MGGRTTTALLRAWHWLAPALAFALVGSALAQQEGRIGYVDMQRLIDHAPQVAAARERLSAEFAEKDRKLTFEEARLAEQEQRLRNEAATLPEDQLEALQRQTDALRRSVERTRERLREELTERRDQELERAWPLINEMVAEFAREEGYDLIVPSPVVYVSGRIDVTERVLERLRQEFARSGTRP